ncbi:hypothetical protein PsorP6_018103 [Peronosclerospora sorghi]|uniref:Uncharacterized protein n=1 Tax=Peronosclerospora sorghi TaxID=230839 RepID=A0ACC0WC34_9STRA|nr:hypothetical protein PsorP6_018103 [Peronosclerospora sorghi]
MTRSLDRGDARGARARRASTQDVSKRHGPEQGDRSSHCFVELVGRPVLVARPVHSCVVVCCVQFVDLDVIAGVAVTEAITFSNVVYSLVLMVEGQRDMEVPFETFRPRIAVLQDIYLETRALLFPSGSDRTMRLPVDVSPRPWH